MKTKRILLIGSVCLALMLAVPIVAACAPEAPAPAPAPTPAPPVEKVFKWRMQTEGNRGTAYHQSYIDYWEKPLEAMSGGMLEIETFGRGELASDAEAVTATQTGLLEMEFDYAGWHIGTYPAEAVDAGMPGSIRKPSDNDIFFNRMGYTAWKQKNVFDDLGIKLICPVGESPAWLMSSKPVKCLDDLKGMKIRSSGIMNKVLEGLGATMLTIEGPEVYAAGMSGVLDGATLGGLSEMTDAKLHEPFPYVLKPPLQDYNLMRLIINMDAWNELPDNLKHIIWEGSWCCTLKYNNNYSLRDLEAFMKFQEENKITVNTLPPEDAATLQAAKMAAWDSYAAEHPLNAEAIQMLKDFVKLMGYA